MRRTHLASCVALFSLVGMNQFVLVADPAHADQPIVSATDAVARLKQGNARFTAGNLQHPHESNEERCTTICNRAYADRTGHAVDSPKADPCEFAMYYHV